MTFMLRNYNINVEGVVSVVKNLMNNCWTNIDTHQMENGKSFRSRYFHTIR